MRENNDKKKKRKEEEEEMNWPDDDFIFQQQEIEFRLILISFFRSVFFFSNLFSRMYIRRLNKYESKRIQKMILDEAARQRLFFSLLLLASIRNQK
jgi:hypothetical protein